MLLTQPSCGGTSPVEADASQLGRGVLTLTCPEKPGIVQAVTSFLLNRELDIVEHQAKPRLLVMVSKLGHCPNDLLFCWRAGTLGGDIAVVVSNHETLRQMTEAACRSWFSLRTCRFSPTTSARSYRVLFHGGSTVVFR